ncbi:TPA: DNA circularization N-terminal domain-containing protein [Klebsiella pneumoniae]|nr:DNA circularization N-terminal domain-containing protein [Klebsiella pneumoniae]HBY8547647.1 DNA circularization N-terminal domain-containing protein [Klebsiella pneumoniae]HBY8828346.1 DNA circularization N-terminal domain-containing protein [Klebsiella pneumoniae]HBY9116009.1 DNA circularization N-terminal domain-containing protein [Klebsiella pneumoniae]HBY9597604.1 DNA circularization N-terminal domain-containing protein [Klebsiella pneumoniae]
MAWETDLQDASFRGVAFDIITTRDSVQRDIAQHEYPYRNGANIDDLGGKPRSLQCQAVFFGDDYESRLQAFIAALDVRGSGELIHPVFGSMPNMLCYVYQVNHDAETPDYCTVDLQFLQSGLDVKFFVREWPLSQADAIFNQAQEILDSTATLLDNAMKPLRTARQYMARAKALGVTGLNMAAILRSEITGFISSTTDFVNFPAAFMTDLQSALSLQSSAATSSISSDSAVYASVPSVVLADWSAVKTQADEVAVLPASLVNGDATASVEMPANITTTDIRELIAMTQLAVALELSQQAADLLSDETVTAALSPDDISLITGDARRAVQNAIDSVRSTWAAEMETVSSSTTSIALEYEPVINGLRDTALSLQSMATALIQARPPLIQRTVASAANLHLLAHLWYGDYSRATELKLLNPSLRDPNNIIAGDVLNGYAE